MNEFTDPMQETLSPLSSVLGFDVIEFWSPDENHSLQCVHYHLDESVKQVVKRLFPKESHFRPAMSQSWREHSLKLCQESRFTEHGYMWNSVSHRKLVIPRSDGKEDVTLPVATEVARPITDDLDRTHFVVCYTRSVVEFTAVKIKYLSFICEAALLAAGNFGDMSHDLDDELDKVSFAPRELTAYGSGLNLVGMGHDEAAEMGCWSHHSSHRFQEQKSRDLLAQSELMNLPPTWEPVDVFNFPVAEIPATELIPDNLSFDNFTDLRHIADGSNANIYTAQFQGGSVVVKIIKESVRKSKVAVHEFDVEHGILARLRHPQIIRLLGAGKTPRRFIVLEELHGGTLSSVLAVQQEKRGLATKLFRKATFTYAQLLAMARDIADALHYLHTQVHPGATVVHRDIKPDNIGFTEDGSVKLFDFGLSTCIKMRSDSTECYSMTGNTGSLRYMAPEVALRKPYNEKADVYSFAILLWQMGRDKVPFKGLSRSEFMDKVVRRGDRPKLDKSWPPEFCRLLEACWHVDHNQRPSFEIVSHTLTRLILAAETTRDTGRRSSLKGKVGPIAQSTWF